MLHIYVAQIESAMRGYANQLTGAVIMSAICDRKSSFVTTLMFFLVIQRHHFCCKTHQSTGNVGPESTVRTEGHWFVPITNVFSELFLMRKARPRCGQGRSFVSLATAAAAAA